MAAKKKQASTNLKTGILVGASIASAIAGGIFLYGPQGKKNRKQISTWAIKAKADVLDEMSKMKEVSEEKYHWAVDKTMTKYGRLKNISQSEVIELGKELKKHWLAVSKEALKKKK